MPRDKKRKQHKRPTKKLFFERPYGVKLEELLDIYLDVIGNSDAEIDMKIDKISISLIGDRSNNDMIASKLQELQGQLMKATTPDANGNYFYEQELFPLIFNNPIQTRFLADILAVFKYTSELTEDKTIITNASLYDVQRLQKIGYSSLNQSPKDQNKDIQRFALLNSLKLSKSPEEILQLGIANGLLFEKEGKIHFSNTREKTQEGLNEILIDLSFTSDSTDQEVISTLDPEIEGLGFQGGKIVFVNDIKKNDRKRKANS
ncbi:MAG: hypothetical protein HeimC2_46210 [Candidatus Heimdallarchaeota archaeon LC_2]|nr:MAG: hypothetical protein HeimC2_46210 [Candidatus Heimdallarchaeota archaeon LC_2]